MVKFFFRTIKILFIIFCIWFIIGSINYTFFWSKLGKGYFLYETGTFYRSGVTFIKSEYNKTLSLANILEWNKNNKYIIAKQIPFEKFKCGNINKTIMMNKVRYIIIDKDTNIINATYSGVKFDERLNDLSININFNNKKREVIANKLKKTIYKKYCICIKKLY